MKLSTMCESDGPSNVTVQFKFLKWDRNSVILFCTVDYQVNTTNDNLWIILPWIVVGKIRCGIVLKVFCYHDGSLAIALNTFYNVISKKSYYLQHFSSKVKNIWLKKLPTTTVRETYPSMLDRMFLLGNGRQVFLKIGQQYRLGLRRIPSSQLHKNLPLQRKM